MENLYGEGVANHTGPESCGREQRRKGPIEALTGERASGVLSREIHKLWGADAVHLGVRRRPDLRFREWVRNPARSEASSVHASTSRENREIPRPPREDSPRGRIGKSKDARR